MTAPADRPTTAQLIEWAGYYSGPAVVMMAGDTARMLILELVELRQVAQPQQPGGEEALVEALLTAKTTETPEGLQYVLIRGLHAMGYAQSQSESYELARAAIAAVRTHEGWQCAARRSGTAGGNDPADCDWPHCGCDEHASKVLESLQEEGLDPDSVRVKALREAMQVCELNRTRWAEKAEEKPNEAGCYPFWGARAMAADILQQYIRALISTLPTGAAP